MTSYGDFPPGTFTDFPGFLTIMLADRKIRVKEFGLKVDTHIGRVNDWLNGYLPAPNARVLRKTGRLFGVSTSVLSGLVVATTWTTKP